MVVHDSYNDNYVFIIIFGYFCICTNAYPSVVCHCVSLSVNIHMYIFIYDVEYSQLKIYCYCS